MSSTWQSESPEFLQKLNAHVEKINARLKEENVKNGDGERWLNENIPDWKTSVDGRIRIDNTRWGYPQVYPKYRQRRSSFGREAMTRPMFYFDED
jgi:hypothetical protein